MPAPEPRSPISIGLRQAFHDLGEGLAIVCAGAYALLRLGTPPRAPTPPVGEDIPPDEDLADEDLALIEKVAPFPSHD